MKNEDIFFCMCNGHAIKVEFDTFDSDDGELYIYFFDMLPSYRNRNFWARLKICLSLLFKWKNHCYFDIVLNKEEAKRLGEYVLKKIENKENENDK